VIFCSSCAHNPLTHCFLAWVLPISSVKPPRQCFGNEVGCFCEHKCSWIDCHTALNCTCSGASARKRILENSAKKVTWAGLSIKSGELEESTPVNVGKGGDLTVQDRQYLLKYLVQRYLLFGSDFLRRNQCGSWYRDEKPVDKGAFGRCTVRRTSNSLGKWSGKSFSYTLFKRASTKGMESHSPVLCYLVAACVWREPWKCFFVPGY